MVECSIDSTDEPTATLHVTIENRGTKQVQLRALRLFVAKIWDIPAHMSTGLVPWKEPDLPRINIPERVGEQAQVTLTYKIAPGTSAKLSWNLFSREARNDGSKFMAFPYPYGLLVFHLQPTIVTNAGELELPALAVHLHGFGMIGGIGQLQVTRQQYGSCIDEACEALALIESGVVAGATLAANLKEKIDHYRDEKSI